jgi:hypothetical protein
MLDRPWQQRCWHHRLCLPLILSKKMFGAQFKNSGRIDEIWEAKIISIPLSLMMI